MANIDTLTEGLYKLIHKLAGDSTTTDAQIEEALDNMTFVQACDKLIEEVEDGDLSIASGASTLATLNDTTITSATDGQVLKYNGSKWVNATDTDTDELEDLSDVALATPANGQVLTYDGTAAKWKNANASGGGGCFIVTITVDSNVYSSDKTTAQIVEAFSEGLLPIAKFVNEGNTTTPIYQAIKVSESLCAFSNFDLMTVDTSTFVVGDMFSIAQNGTVTRTYYEP